MNVLVSNEITITDPKPETIKWIEQNLVVNNPVYRQLKIMGKEDTIRKRHVPEYLNLFSKRGDKYTIPFGCVRPIWSMLDSYDTKFNNNEKISIVNDIPTLPPFDYQEEAINYMIKAKGGVLVSPCGSGKTLMGIEILRRLGLKTLWLCHTGDLLRQAKGDMLAQYPNIKIGLTTDGKLEIGEDVTISTVQTMEKIDPDLYRNEFDVVIVDECAHCVAAPTQMKMFVRVLSNIPARYKFGLTATPARNDGMIKAMYAYIGMSPYGRFEPAFTVSKDRIKTMISEHVKYEISSGYDGYLLSELYDPSGMIIFNDLISSLVDNESRNEQIVENIVKNDSEGRKQVILSNRVEHCENIVKMLKQRGVNAVLCVGKRTGAKERERILKKEIDSWNVLVSTYALLKEGVSIKELDTLHMITPIKDKSMVVQCAGRIERYLEGKKQPIVYDYVDVDIPYCEKAYIERRRALKSRF